MKYAIAEDHELYRQGLVLLLNELDQGAEIIEAADFPSVRSIVDDNSDLNLLILDIQLPGTKALEGISYFRQYYPLMPIVVISVLEMGANVSNVMDLGVNGFIAKSTPKDIMLHAIAQILQGEVVVLTGPMPNSDVKLSPRQIDTLTLMTKGLSNKEIAKSLGISDTTVREYVSGILQQLDVDNRVKAVVEAKKLGIILD